jgi:signal peptidase II
MKYLLFLGLPLLVLDQITKYLVLRNIPYGGEVPVIPGFFSLVHTTNTGAAFGMFQNNNLFFILLAVTAFVVILFLLIRDQTNPKARLAVTTKISFGLLAGGILGNLVDRVTRGNVVDFLNFYIHQYAWPAFNVADSCICVAVGLLVLTSFRPPRNATEQVRPARRDK